jgi:hypothetical protein
MAKTGQPYVLATRPTTRFSTVRRRDPSSTVKKNRRRPKNPARTAARSLGRAGLFPYPKLVRVALTYSGLAACFLAETRGKHRNLQSLTALEKETMRRPTGRGTGRSPDLQTAPRRPIGQAASGVRCFARPEARDPLAPDRSVPTHRSAWDGPRRISVRECLLFKSCCIWSR